MTNTERQRELLMETQTANQVLQFALNRERGQENQKAINTQLNRNPLNAFDQISHIIPSQRNEAYNQITRPRTPVRNSLPQRNTNITNPCRRCGIQFTPEHLLICPTKKVQCNLCKKIGHFCKVCRSAKLMWQTRQIRPQQSTFQQNIPQTRRVRNIRTTKLDQQHPPHNQDTQSENNDKTIDLENTFFTQEVFDSWNAVNFIKPKTFNNVQPSNYSPTLTDEIWVKTTSDGKDIEWLADTGSPSSFIGKKEANRILQECKSAKRKDSNKCQTKIQTLQQHRDPNRRSNPTETKIRSMGSSQQRNPRGKLKHCQPTRT